MTHKKKTLLVIDAHALIHRAYHALPPLASPRGEPAGAVYGFTSVLIKALRELKPDYVVAAFDLPGPTFRHKEFAEYKAQRPATPEDLKEQFGTIRKIVDAFGIPVLEKQSYEADDIIGTLTQKYLRKEKAKGELGIIILSGDLDTLQLVDSHTEVYTFRRGFSDVVIYDPSAVEERFGIAPLQLADFKGLVGDPSDNIPGVAGVGEKTARDLIQRFGSIEMLYKNLEKNSLSPRVEEKLRAGKEQAFFSKQLATIYTDVALSFELSRAKWKEHCSAGALADLFRDLGFYSLLKRISALELSSEPGESVKAPADEATFPEKGATPFRSPSSKFFLDVQFAGREGGSVRIIKKNSSRSLDLSRREAKQFLEDTRFEKVVYDLKFLLKEFSRRGIQLRGATHDLLIMAYLVDPGEEDYSVPRLCARYVGSRGGAQNPFPSLFAALDGKINEAKLEHILRDIEMPLVSVLAKMEETGIRVSTSRLEQLSRILAREILDREKKIYRLGGRKFNINSPKELRTLLFEELGIPSRRLKKTPTGFVSTSAGDLAGVESLHPIVPPLLDYRELFKLKSTYVDALPRLVKRRTKRIHTTFHQTTTATGRLSSSNPNLQNIPKRGRWAKEIRSAFVAPRGSVFVSFDYSQIELRIIAHLSRDKKMCEAFARGEDIHTFTASLLWGVDEAHVTPALRESAKAVNFGLMYGVSARRIARSLKKDLSEARSFLRNYFQKFEGVARYIEQVKERAREQGFVETVFGRRRYLPGIHSSRNDLRAEAERMAVNMTAQGTNADFIKLAMIRTVNYLEEQRLDARLVLQIHDDLLFEIRRDIVKETVPHITRIMETVHTLSVPLEVDVTTGSDWGNMVQYNKHQ